MLQLPVIANGSTDKLNVSAPHKGASLELTWMLGVLRRQWLLITLLIVAALALAIAYLILTPPRYTATSELMLDNQRLELSPQSIVSEIRFDGPAVETQLQVLKSKAIAATVISTLGLATDPEFNGSPAEASIRSVLNPLLALVRIGPHESRNPDDIGRRQLKYFQDNLEVQRVGRSYIIHISFRSVDPVKAAQIVNAVAETYANDRLKGKHQANQRVSEWLKDQVSELRQRAELTDRAAAEFRSKNSLTEAGGKLLAEQQLSEINSQLVLAQGQTAQAKARLDRIIKIGQSGMIDATIADSLQNPILGSLQQKLVEAVKREAEYSSRYGTDHAATLNVRKDMQQLQGIIRSEMGRISEGYRSEYEIARGREQALQVTLSELRRQTDSAHRAQIGLRLLESSANAYRTLHGSLLQRFLETAQQQSLLDSEVQIITRAENAEKTHPNAKIVLGVAGLFGACLGCAAAFAREGLDQKFHTPRQVELALGVECLGIVPAIQSTPSGPSPQDDTLRSDTEARLVAADDGVGRYSTLNPNSQFSETMRAIKVAADTSTTIGVIKVFGIVSAAPEEGKSTVASNLALLVAHMGRRTLLIDGDLRRSSLTRQLAPQAKAGLLEVLAGTSQLENVVWREPASGLHFLPAADCVAGVNTSHDLGSDRMADLLASARNSFDYVIVDLPPLVPAVDAKAIANYIDGFVVVVQWGRTASEFVADTLRSAEAVRSKVIGIVLNKANVAKLRKYERNRSASYERYFRH